MQRVCAFVGPAGTGKSQRAQLVADGLEAEYIIDDGLVVRRSSIVAGRSAKAERNQIRAIRRAMFEYDDHRDEVRQFFEGRDCAVMVIATSEGMAERIAARLGLPPPSKVVRIEDVATPDEIERAKRQRRLKRQHVIPVSHAVLRQNFAGKLVAKLKILWKDKMAFDGEKTIVRPPFSFYGDVKIKPRAIEQIVEHVASRGEQVADVRETSVSMVDGDWLRIFIELAVSPGARSMLVVSESVRQAVARSVRFMSGLDVREVAVAVTATE